MEDHDDRDEKLEDNLNQILLHKTPDSLAFYTREYSPHGTNGLRMVNYIDCREVQNKIDYLKFEYWNEFEIYRDSDLLTVEMVMLFVNTLNNIIKLIQQRGGNTNDFENYILQYSHILNPSYFQKEIEILNPFILSVISSSNKNETYTDNDFPYSE